VTGAEGRASSAPTTEQGIRRRSRVAAGSHTSIESAPCGAHRGSLVCVSGSYLFTD